jgi:Domain of unknown function (DUF397)
MTLAGRTSTFSGRAGDRVEVARSGGHVLVGNAHAPDAGTLAVSPAEPGAWPADRRAGVLDDLAG